MASNDVIKFHTYRTYLWVSERWIMVRYLWWLLWEHRTLLWCWSWWTWPLLILWFWRRLQLRPIWYNTQLLSRWRICALELQFLFQTVVQPHQMPTWKMARVRIVDGEKMQVHEFCLHEVDTSHNDGQIWRNLPPYSANNSPIEGFSWLTLVHLRGRHRRQNVPPLQLCRLCRLWDNGGVHH